MLIREISKTLRHPARIFNVFNCSKILGFFQMLKNDTIDGVWRGNHFKTRVYANYSAYVQHQQSKLSPGFIVALEEYRSRFPKVLRKRLESVGELNPGMSVLCLGARLGEEVKAFHELGCFAVGIDLNPGRENPYVLNGDFHELVFPNSSVDIVFSNVIDHVFDIKVFLSESRRVLKPTGCLILEAGKGQKEGGRVGAYESFSWSTIDELVDLLEHSWFKVVHRMAFDYPWQGEQLWFRMR